jgi:glutathione peroxidase
MKYLLSLITCLLLFSFQQTEAIYDVTLTSIDGNKIELSQYKGKKLLFILLPLSAKDTTVSINDIAALQTKYQSSLVIIGIPSEEAGYQTQDADRLQQIYKDARTNIIITEGMKVKKGTGQSSLLQWLTSKDKNHHFDQDVQQQVGSKFFVDEAGELYAVMGTQLKLTSAVTDKILSRSHLKP